MLTSVDQISVKYRDIINRLRSLETLSQYTGVVICGSVIKQLDHDPLSDLDTFIITTKKRICPINSHPIIDGVRLDISFRSFNSLKKYTYNQLIYDYRKPAICDSIIIFDKYGEISKLKNTINNCIHPPEFSTEDKYRVSKFFRGYIENVERFININPAKTILLMDMYTKDLLKHYYKLRNKWWPGEKYLLDDLILWDLKLYDLFISYLKSNNLKTSVNYWEKIVNHILSYLPEQYHLSEVCNCNFCQKEINQLMKVRISV